MAALSKSSIRKKMPDHPRLKAPIVLLAATVFVVGFGLLGAYRLSDPPSKSAPPYKALDKSIQQGIRLPNDFTLNDKIGQLLMVGVTSKNAAINLERNYQVGGFLIRPGADLFNKDATNAVKRSGELAPLFAVDEEGGEISRLPGADFSRYSAKYLGTLPDAQVKQIGINMGSAIKDVGANVDFAPVVDLDNGQNAAISLLERSFSSDPAVVADKAQAFAGGLAQAGIAATFKHFPGLGNATGPTHGNTDTAAATSPPLASLEQNDLIPYKTLLQSGELSTVMMGNQVVPGLTNDLPASLSGNAYDLLRNEYGFGSVVFTDELILAQAVASVEPSPAAAVIAAIKGGADMPLIDTDDGQTVNTIIQAVADAVRSGQIKESQINASLGRILKLKTALQTSQ